METEITNETLAAIKAVSEQVIPKKEKRKEKLPAYFLEEEFDKFMKVVKKPHHRLAFNLAFHSGLRVSEVVNLLPENVDLTSRIINVRNAKGGKDRVVPLPKGFPDSALKLLPINCDIRALQIAFQRNLKKSGITKPGLVFHSLRHSFATTAQKKGIPLNVIQVLMGHSNISTTNIYTKMNPTDALKSYVEKW